MPKQTKTLNAVDELELIDQCFETYYKLGAGRSLRAVSKRHSVSLDDLEEWADGYAWEEKISQRERDLERQLNSLYKHRTMKIRDTLVKQIGRLLHEMEQSTIGLPFSIRDANDLKTVSQAYLHLVQASQLARSAAVDATDGKHPTTWSDLLEQSKVDKPEDDV